MAQKLAGCVPIAVGEQYQLEFDGALHRVEVRQFIGGLLEARIDGRAVSARVERAAGRLWLRRLCRSFEFEEDPGRDAHASVEHEGHLRAPMPGHVLDVRTTAGARVARGAVLLVLEAMKMEHSLVAPWDAVVAEVRAKAGDRVEEGAELVLLTPQDAAG